MAKFSYRGAVLEACEALYTSIPPESLVIFKKLPCDKSHICFQDLRSSSGTIIFVSADDDVEAFPLTLEKRVYFNDAPAANPFLNFTKEDVLNASTDLMGNKLLGIHGNPFTGEPSWDDVASVLPPLRKIGAFYPGARVWVANRESGRDITFDEQG